MTLIAHRPLEAADRAIAGHREGDLIIGRGQSSAIGTLVERSTRYVMLIHLPRGWKAPQFRNALIIQTAGIPAPLRKTLTWDQAREMPLHEDIAALTGFAICFCDPHSPSQRGTSENTNGLLRQYFPKAPTCPSTPPATSTRSPASSTTAPAPFWATRPQPKP